jgi:hypothetical protein
MIHYIALLPLPAVNTIYKHGFKLQFINVDAFFKPPE